MLLDLGAMPRHVPKQNKIAPLGRDGLALFRENLDRLAKSNKSNMKQYGTKAGLGTTFVRDVIEGQDPGLSKIVAIAKTYGLSIDKLVGLETRDPDDGGARTSTIKVIGEVGAGKWHELDGFNQLDFEPEPSPVPADPHYPVAAQFDLIVRGSSINRIARDGQYIRCVDVKKAIIEPYDNDFVIVRRTRSGGLVETTAKKLRRRGPIIELWPESDDPKWQQPERIDTRQPREGETAEIVGLVLYAYSPGRSRSRIG
jgi:hypothetical protein